MLMKKFANIKSISYKLAAPNELKKLKVTQKEVQKLYIQSHFLLAERSK